MAFGGSGFSSEVFADILTNDITLDLDGDTWKVALFPNTITPDFTVATASFAYDAGVYTSGAELTGGSWPAGGYTLVSPSVTAEQPAAGQVRFDANDVSQATTTIVDARGCLLYSDTEASDTGLLVVDFGSAFSTTNGTFAITWDSNGIAYFDIW